MRGFRSRLRLRRDRRCGGGSGSRFRLGRGHRLFGLVDLVSPRVLQTLQLTLRPGIGALQAVLALPKLVDERDLEGGPGFLRQDAFLGDFHARKFPLRDCHLLHIELFGPRLRLPFGFQIAAKLVEFPGVFGGQHDGAGAKTVAEGVHANSRFCLGSPWAR